LPLLFNFALEYAIKRVQANKDSLKQNYAHYLLVYTDYVKYWVEAHTLYGKTHKLQESPVRRLVYIHTYIYRHVLQVLKFCL
jgi:hypothetical protein